MTTAGISTHLIALERRGSVVILMLEQLTFEGARQYFVLALVYELLCSELNLTLCYITSQWVDEVNTYMTRASRQTHQLVVCDKVFGPAIRISYMRWHN